MSACSSSGRAMAAPDSAPGEPIQVIGSGELVQTLIRHDLVDEYR